MNIIMMMFDSLNRRFLSAYGCGETITPNFSRLAEHTVRFDNCCTGSLPCIPARRELHTGRYNFMHRSWGPLEPFDDSVPRTLTENGIHSHLVTDHGHYWEEGGATYHTQFSTWEIIRGQEGDKWQAVVGGAEDKDPNFKVFSDLHATLYKQNLANRTAVKSESDYPIVKTFDKGLEFLQSNYGKGDFFLQIESFSPHEPFMTPDRFKDMYGAVHSKKYEWPDYSPADDGEDVIEQVRKAYFASLTMCDEQLGRLLDYMDGHDIWNDTMLIVNTDHGYMLGEHGYWAKNYMPCFEEIVHTPLFVWDPRYPETKNTSRNALVQTIDIPATILDFFGIPLYKDMQGRSVIPAISENSEIREDALFGMFGGHACIKHGNYVYMKAPRNTDIPMYEYTLMPTHMMDFFKQNELESIRCHLPFEFTKNIPVMEIETDRSINCIVKEDLLFDLAADPDENDNLIGKVSEKDMDERLKKCMEESDAPESLMKRFGY